MQIKNLSLTLEDFTDSITKTTAAQQRSLNSLAKVVFDDRIALDYLLAEQGGVCIQPTAKATLELILLGK